MHKSISTIASPQFINLQPLELNPLMDACEIKVLYIGQNRNRSFITKEVATEMAKTLRGCPIVGYFNQGKDDFRDHGHELVIDGDGIKFNCLTRPYGFVAPDAKVWFQTFEDEDDFGNKVQRQYLMTTGYLWTGQFEQCKRVVEQGRPHSMQLDEKTIDGRWSTDNKSGVEYFIINDATFSKLCILGDDVEPCFEGSSVIAPTVSASFTVDDNFKQTLYSMMQDLKNFAYKGGSPMENENMNSELEQPTESENPETEFTQEEENNAGEASAEFADAGAAHKPKKDEEEEEEKSDDSEDGAPEKKEEESKDDEEDKEKKKNFELEERVNDLQTKFDNLNNDYAALSEKYEALKKENESLASYKSKIEDKQKDDLIAQFYMLSDEDKQDVIANKSTYTLEEIENKLSVICFRKKVSFADLEEEEDNENDSKKPVMTFNLNDEIDSVPAWIQAVKNNRNN